MPNIVDFVKSHLEENVVVADLADGGIYTERIDKNSTPRAFNEQPPNLPRRSVSIVGGISTADPRIPGVETTGLTLWVRWNDHHTQNPYARQLILACRADIDQKVIGGNPICGMVEYIDEFEQPDPWIKGGRMSYVRFRVAGMAVL